MAGLSQTGAPAGQPVRTGLIWVAALLSALPSLIEGAVLIWGARQGFTGKALRDGLDFWAGGFLLLHRRTATLFNPTAYEHFITAAFGPHLPVHLWSYPPNYLLLAGCFGWLPPWPAVLAFDALSLLLLVFLLLLAGQPRLLVLAVAFSPAALENWLEGQNAALMTALIGGGLLLLETKPRLGGALIGLATIKPQLGLVLPLHLLRAPVALACAVLSATALGLAALLVAGPAAFAGGLISVFATARPLGLQAALAIQAAISAAAILLAARVRKPTAILILCALASPYLHDYDLLGVALAVALLAQERLTHGFAPGEALLFFLAWAGPGALPWVPRFAHLTPLILLLLLASAMRRDRVPACDSRTTPGLPASSAGP